MNKEGGNDMFPWVAAATVGTVAALLLKRREPPNTAPVASFPPGSKPKPIKTNSGANLTQSKRTGVVLPLTAQQRIVRMLWLAGEATLDQLDDFIYKPPMELLHRISGYTTAKEPVHICDIRYSLAKPGGRYPTAIDFGDRSSNNDVTFATADCIGGMAWCGGWDRYQPKQFSHLYGGWINTNSMWQDAHGQAKCFKLLNRPEPGCFVVYPTRGQKMGHIGGVTKVPAEWDPKLESSWAQLQTVDMAARPERGNRRGNPIVWFKEKAEFVVSLLAPDYDSKPVA